MKLKGKRVLITGAAGGLGRCLVDRFSRAGAQLILLDIDEAGLSELSSAEGVLLTRNIDITDRAQVEDFAAEIVETYGGIDVLVNNAGIGLVGELAETSLEDWHRLMDVDFWGPLYLVYAFMPTMAQAANGHVVNITSGQAFYQLPTWGPYNIVKLALAAFSETLRLEGKKLGIRVTTVYPFVMDTEGFFSDIEGETWGARLSLKLVPWYAMKPDSVAKRVVRAVERRKGVEMVSPLNWVGYYGRVTPALRLFNRAAFRFLGKPAAEIRSRLAD